MNTDKNLTLQTHAAAALAATLATAPAVNEYPEQELTGAILQAAFAVHNTLGAGFLERVYSNALAIELDAKGSHSAQLMNCLRATNIRVGLLLNFGRPKLEYRRFVC
jgi:hypothetical protein